MNNIEIFEDSPNGYVIVKDCPTKSVDDAIHYYLDMLDRYVVKVYPEEYGLICYSMGKLLLTDKGKSPYVSVQQEERAKRIENALYYFNAALVVFTPQDYPIMFSIISIFMGKLFRERSMLISQRNFLAERSSAEESLQYGVDQMLEAMPILSISKTHQVEYAVCCLELAYLHVLQTELPRYADDNYLREQALAYLDRTLSISEALPPQIQIMIARENPVKWRPNESKTFPDHIRLLLDDHQFVVLEGTAFYLQGRLEQGWGTFGTEETASSEPNEHISNAYRYYCKSYGPKYLPKTLTMWADAHHRVALLIVKYPSLVDPDYGKPGEEVSDIYLDSALSHISLALRCEAVPKTEKMDLHFHLAQTFVSKLQLIIDRVPYGESVTKAIIESDGLELITKIEENLRQALKRVTAANTQSIHDAYVYFYASMKLAEYRMLQAACTPQNEASEREDHLRDAIEFIIDSSISRPLADNMDLHYIACSQLAQVLMAVKRTHAASKSYAKLLFCLSTLANRSMHNVTYFEYKFREDLFKHAGSAINTAVKDTTWIKLHLGPQNLHERPAGGYASWSFEDLPTIRKKKKKEPDMALLTSPEGKKINPVKFTKSAPPRGIPPLNLTQTNIKRVYISGEEMPSDAVLPSGNIGDNASVASGSTSASKFKPPPGPVPLAALGYATTLEDLNDDDHSLVGGIGRDESSASMVISPYTGRMRSKVPPLKIMKEIDKGNRVAFGLTKGNVAYLIPARHGMNAQGHVQAKIGDKKPFNSPGKTKTNVKFSGDDGIEDEKEDDLDNDSKDGVGSGSKNQIKNNHARDEDEGDDNASNAKSIVNRARSTKIRRPPSPQMREVEEESDEEDDDETKRKKKGGVVTWLFGGSKKKKEKETKVDESRPLGEKKPSLLKSVFKQFRKTKADPKKVENLADTVGMWSSKQAYFAFMVLSRQSRMDLIMKSKRLNVLDGERACAILYKVKPKYLTLYYYGRAKLYKFCKDILPPINSLKELSALSVMDLQVLFRSHAKIASRIDDFEHFLAYKLSKADYFLPMVGAIPAFSRDIASFDDSLLNANILLSNMSYERALPDIRLDLEQGKKIKFIEDTGKPGDHKKHRSHDSVSSHAASSVNSNQLSANKKASNKTEEEKQQEVEEQEEVRAGKMTFSLSQELDGCGFSMNGQQGAKDMLIRYLAQDECILMWHLPAVVSQTISCVLIWRENSESLHEHFSSQEAIQARLQEEEEGKKSGHKGGKHHKNADHKGKGPDVRGIVIEFAKSDLQASHLMQFIQRYLDALHAKTLPSRLAQSTDVLRSLSCALSITELLLMIPSYVRSLVICCPPVMRMIPWHLLLFETTRQKSPLVGIQKEHSGQEDLIEAHLLEKYCVRLGPSLNIWELCSIAGTNLRQSVGLHRLCAIDGDDRFNRNITSNTDTPSKPGARTKGAVAGIRGADLEVASIAHTWSADPEDYHILADHAATPTQLETSSFADDNLEKYKKFKLGVRINGRAGDDEELDPNEAGDGEKEKRRKELRQLHSKKFKEKLNKIRSGNNGDESDESNSSDDGKKKKKKKGKDSAETEEQKEMRRNHKRHVRALTMCRVLHICANKIHLSENDYQREVGIEASIQLPESFDLMEKKTKAAMKQDKGIFTVSDLIYQIYVKNCALCVLSRFGLTDDVPSNKSPIIEANWEFIEAMHLAGACSIMVPLWEGGGQGIGTLAFVVFLIRFYSILPSKSRDRLSIVETVRKCQLWLKDVTANDVIAFIHKAPIPKRAREIIIDEMESYVTASISTKPLASDDKHDPNRDGNRIGGSRKFFTHYLHWGAFVVTGFGGNVHHPNLTEDLDEDEAVFGGDNVNEDDEELNNIEFEASVLRMEGKIEEAMALEKRIRELRLLKLKRNIQNLQATGWKAGRGVLDMMDYLDKTFLDQESDEVSFSEEEEDKNGDDDDDENSKKKKGDDETSRKGELNDANSVSDQSSISPYRPLDPDYFKWKGRVGGLNMNVPLPTLPDKNKKIKSITTKSPKKDFDIKKKDNYEFSMLKSVKAGPIVEIEEEEEFGDDEDYFPDQEDDKDEEDEEEEGDKGDDEDSDSLDEADFEGLDARQIRRIKKEHEIEKQKKQKKKMVKEIVGGVRSYAEIAKMLAEKSALDKKMKDVVDRVKDEANKVKDKVKDEAAEKAENCIIS